MSKPPSPEDFFLAHESVPAWFSLQSEFPWKQHALPEQEQSCTMPSDRNGLGASSLGYPLPADTVSPDTEAHEQEGHLTTKESYFQGQLLLPL